MRRLILSAAACLALGALATTAVARWRTESAEAAPRPTLGCAVRVAGIEHVPVAPRQALIQIDEVLIVGEITRPRRVKQYVLADHASDPPPRCDPTWHTLGSGPSERRYREICGNELQASAAEPIK